MRLGKIIREADCLFEFSRSLVSLYPWCSAGWFQRRAATSFYKTIMRYGIERVKAPDDFAVEWSSEGG